MKLSLTGADLDALRYLRSVVAAALDSLRATLLAGGRIHELTRAFDGLSLIDRILGDRSSAPIVEEHTLTCVRIGRSLGWTVMFGPEPDEATEVTFHKPHAMVAVPGLLAIDGPIDEMLARALAAAEAEARGGFKQ